MKRAKICGLYKITSPTGKIYIGQAFDINARWNVYRLYRCKQQTKLYTSFIKHGVENHRFEIICECDKDSLNYGEKYLIEFYKTFDTPHGLNLTSGGDNFSMSESSKKKISDLHKGENYGMKGKKHSEATKALMSENCKGEKNHQYGKKQSEETIKKRSNSLKGKRLGHKHSPETIEKIKEKRKHQVNPWLGKKQTEEHKRKMVETRRRNGSYKHNEETKRKISEFHKNRKKSKKFCEKISKRFKGKPLSEEHKQALRDGWAKRKERLKLEKENNGTTISK